MKPEEEQALYKEKRSEGKSIERANAEIQRLKNSQITFKEKEREIIRLNKKVENLEKENSLLKNKKFIKQLKSPREIKQPTSGSIVYAKRVMEILREEKRPLTKTQLREFCCCLNKEINGVIGFLEKYGLIKLYSKDYKGEKYIVNEN